MQRLVGWVPVSWLGHHAKQLNQQPATTTPTATPTATALTATPTKQTPETVPMPTPHIPLTPGQQKQAQNTSATNNHQVGHGW